MPIDQSSTSRYSALSLSHTHTTHITFTPTLCTSLLDLCNIACMSTCTLMHELPMALILHLHAYINLLYLSGGFAQPAEGQNLKDPSLMYKKTDSELSITAGTCNLVSAGHTSYYPAAHTTGLKQLDAAQPITCTPAMPNDRQACTTAAGHALEPEKVQKHSAWSVI